MIDFLSEEPDLSFIKDCTFESIGEPTPEDLDPEGWRYYSDVVTAETLQWLFNYARQHPEDEFIQAKMLSLHDTNEGFKEINGRDLNGWDESFFDGKDLSLD